MPEQPNGERYATQKDLSLAKDAIINHITNCMSTLVSKDTCSATHRFLDTGKFWTAIGVVTVLQVVVLVKIY